MKNNRLSRTSRALIASSLGLPGFSELMAQEPVEDAFDYRFTWYDEDPLPASKVAEGDASRYVIKSHQFRLREAVREGLNLTVDGLHESMSGSSPWFVLPDPVAGPLQVMSGATIRETRDELGVSLGIGDARDRHTVGVSWSTEDDYQSLSASYHRERELASGHTTAAWGLSYSDDRLSPTDATEYGRIEHAQRDSASLSFSLTRIINRNMLLQSGVQLTRQSGFLSDPYKMVWVVDQVLADSRPDERVLFSWTARLRLYGQKSGGALHANYRYFDDDWGVNAHTLDISWHQPFAGNWELAPLLRFHRQGAADFYSTTFSTAPPDGHATSDYRQSGFGATGLGVSVTWRAEDWELKFNAQWYNSSESQALDGARVGTPGLVDFTRFGLGLARRW